MTHEEEKYLRGQEIYQKFLLKYKYDEFHSAAERRYVSDIIEAAHPQGFEKPIPLKEIFLALEYCERAGRRIKIVPNPEFLSGKELEAYRRKHRGRDYLLRKAGTKAGQCDAWRYHIEYEAVPDNQYQSMPLE